MMTVRITQFITIQLTQTIGPWRISCARMEEDGRSAQEADDKVEAFFSYCKEVKNQSAGASRVGRAERFNCH
jgi:hypothetical protein